jgi:hypothetical protein
MKTCALPLRCSALVALVLLGGCATQTATEAMAEPDGTTDQVTSELGAFDPCSGEWQLPTAERYRGLVSADPAFLAFEDRLQAGGARWIGNRGLPPAPYRAIVRVDHFLDFTKKDPHSALWYLAAIPVGATDARRAVRDFARVPPVSSRELGYCLVGGGFLPNHGSGPGSAQVKQIIVEYDPRCVCVATAWTVPVWVDRPTYDSTPSY